LRNPIWRYIVKRLLMAIPLILGAVTITFIIIQLAPGDPIDTLLGEFPASPEYVAQLREEMGLDKSAPEQYVRYVGALAHGNLGYSFRNRRPVAELILERLPATLLLMGTAMVLASAIGVGLGVAASLRPHSIVDNVSSVLAIVGYSMPVFWLGQILLVLFAVELKLFPVQGMTSIETPPTALGHLADVGWHVVLPMLVLSFRYLALNARITRASMLEVFQRDFIITARSKGLSSGTVIWKHAFRNALLPIVTVIGFNFGFVLTGSVLVETIFGWPGIGRLLFESLGTRDYPVMLGVFIIGAATAIVANLLTDISYAFLDPRIRY
jgi:peptide/nickel transport system permease protein